MTTSPLPGYARFDSQNVTRDIFADPEILLCEGKYYLVATSMTSGWNFWHPASPIGIRCHSSDDLETWIDEGMALDASIPEQVKWGEEFFWSPQCIAHPDGYFYMVYNAAGDGYGEMRKKDLALNSSPYQRICIARAKHPAGPYTDFRAPLVTGNEMPGYVDGKAGIIGMIDGYIYRDESTKGELRWYLYWSAIDDENNCNILWGGELTADLAALKHDPKPRMLLGQHVQEWEKHSCSDRLIQEAPSLKRHRGEYYLLYSANSFNTVAYGMGLAISEDPLGPFKKLEGNPFFKSEEDLKLPYSKTATIGPGGGSFFAKAGVAGAAGEAHIVYHTISPGTTEPLCSNGAGHLRRLRMSDVKLP